MKRAMVVLVVVLTGCDPTVSIGDPDAGMDAGTTMMTGDGGDTLCPHLTAASDTFLAGKTSCVGTSNTITADPNALATCEANVQQCTTGDRATLETYARCLEQGPHCTSGNETVAVNQFMNCVSAAVPALTYSCARTLVRSRPAGKRVFITGDKFTADFGGISGADAKCATAASMAGLNGTFKAWISTTTVNAIDRIVDVAPWVDLQGATQFAAKVDLGTGPITGVWYDEFGHFLSSDRIWTGTGSRGKYQSALNAAPCGEWTSAGRLDQARIGMVGQTGINWTSMSGTTCDQLGHLICLEQ
jgi:hypothetical protein